MDSAHKATLCRCSRGCAPPEWGSRQYRERTHACRSVTYTEDHTQAEVHMEPNTNGQSAESDVAMEGDDLLDQASGGKGVNRNSFSLD